MGDDRRLSYFFLGLGIGVAVGVLFAPKSGEETRGLIRAKADESKEYLRKRGEQLYDSAGELVEKSKSALERQREQLSAAVQAGKQAYREAVAAPGPTVEGASETQG
ncbi:MAG: YtxH domain-containing protein [Bryobacteraceae bacterium]